MHDASVFVGHWAFSPAPAITATDLIARLSAAGIVASWTVLPSLGQRASSVCERTEQLLGVTADSLAQVKVSLKKAGADLGAIKEAEKAPAPSKTEQLLTEIRDQLKSR